MGIQYRLLFRREDTPGGREKAPLHPEWEGMARKVMKGADPAETLTWRTPEVKGCGWRVKKGRGIRIKGCGMWVT